MNRPRNILTVDDDYAMLLALKSRLEHAGYRTFTASNGSEALTIIHDNLIDAILLDVGLPGPLNGLEVAESLKNDSNTSSIPIIFVTGYANSEFKRNCEQAGGRYFLTKPYDSDLLIQILRSIFGQDELAQAQLISKAKRRQPVYTTQLH